MNLRDIRNRIVSVKNTQKITRAMKMVSAAKLRRAQEAVLNARPYGRALSELILRIVSHEAGGTEEKSHPLFEERDPVVKMEVLVIASDRGLCGSFNGNIIRKGDEFIMFRSAEGNGVKISTIGRKAREHYNKTNLEKASQYQDLWQDFDFLKAKEVSRDLVKRFLNKETDKVVVVYNEFKSAVTQKLRIEQLLPITTGSLEEILGTAGIELPDKNIKAEDMVRSYLDYIYEESKEKVLETLVPRYIDYKVFLMLLESQASEHGARMSAMDNATNNATEMTDNLTLSYNKARQEQITKELLEIVSGAEALKG
jgi:F-type H+-transporting ATPase subunit gamma